MSPAKIVFLAFWTGIPPRDEIYQKFTVLLRQIHVTEIT